MKSADELIEGIHIDKANLEHIAKTGKINGPLLASIKTVMNDYFNDRKDIPLVYGGAYGMSGIREQLCPKCKYFAEPIIKAKFFTHPETPQRMQLLSINCPKCDAWIEKLQSPFDSKEHEIRQEAFLKTQKINVIIE